jgi:predicted nucleic-acid-binding Zn-ribbon protein
MNIRTDEFLEYLRNTMKERCPTCNEWNWTVEVPEWDESERKYNTYSFVFSKTDENLDNIKISKGTSPALMLVTCNICGYIKLYNAARMKENFLAQKKADAEVQKADTAEV